jgi:RNA polymerase sigma factor (sigma-70 family)
MLEDKFLLWRFKCGSREAFRAIYEKHVTDLLTLAANLLYDSSAAEDIVQEVFISFVKSVDQFRLRGSLKGYLSTCVANRARDYIRQKKRRPSVAVNEAAQMTSAAKSPIQLVICTEELQKLKQAITHLPYKQREVVVLRVHGEMKFRQIAKLQDVSVKTALSRYRYGLNKLRSMLNGEVQK